MNRYLHFIALLCFFAFISSCTTFQEVTPNYPKKVNKLIKKSIQNSDAYNYYLGVSDTIISDLV